MDADRIAQGGFVEGRKQPGTVPPERVLVHEGEILAVQLSLSRTIRVLENVVVRIKRHPRARVAVGILDRVSVQRILSEVGHEPTQTCHSRIVRRDGDEVEVVLIEGAFEVPLARPAQNPFVDLPHALPERGGVIDGRRGLHFMLHLVDRMAGVGRQQLRSCAGIVEISYDRRVLAGSRAAQRFVLARRNVSSILMDVAKQLQVTGRRGAAEGFIVARGQFAAVLMEIADDVHVAAVACATDRLIVACIQLDAVFIQDSAPR